MFNLTQQLYIEGFLSNGKPYLASHPELGVPLGIFNTSDEPNHASRIKSIKKLGPKGSRLSLELAKKLGIKNPIPSFQVTLEKVGGGSIDVTSASFNKAVREYNRIHGTGDSGGATGWDGTAGVADSLGNVLDELSRSRSQADLSMGQAMMMFKTMTNVLKASKEGASMKTDALGTYIHILSLTDQMRKDIINVMGMDEVFMDDIITTVVDAAQEFAGWTLTANDAMEMLKETAQETGRAFILPKEAIVTGAKLQQLYDVDMSNVIANFDKIGAGSVEAVRTTSEAVATAGKYGAVVSKFLPSVEANIEKINTYGFQNGVAGLSEMVAKAQVLGYNFENAMAMADKAFTPEGAIEMAAQLQMIGGAASELLDPFQLMYMAQNDVEGLQDAIIKTAESAVTFNKETGEFGISPGERARLKAMAEATGQDYNNLAETAVKAAKRTRAIGKLGGIPELSEQDKELIASMADINPDGTFSLTIGDEKLSFDELGEEFKTSTKLLGQLRKQSEKDNLSIDDVNKAQLSVQEGMAANTAIIQQVLTQAAASGLLGTTAQDFAGELADSGLGGYLLGEGLENITGGFDYSASTTDYGQTLPPEEQNIIGLLGGFANVVPDFLGAITPDGDPVSESLDKSQRGKIKGELDPLAPSGGAYINPAMINSYLRTPEGQEILNQNITNVGNAVEVKFSPLEIVYDGNTIRLTSKQIMDALDPTVIQSIGKSLSNLNVTTPS
tara:strand:- start:12066 stop:14252 length:2187 start_codon:yes stop_codon:yes gene_type:complete